MLECRVEGCGFGGLGLRSVRSGFSIMVQHGLLVTSQKEALESSYKLGCECSPMSFEEARII